MTLSKPAGDRSDHGAEGMIFSIQRFSLQDGPGIRTTVFLKGCPLRCRWCSNPESQNPEPELMFRNNNCQACGTCAQVCPVGAVTFEHSRPCLDRDQCTLCMDCVKACPGGALEVSGKSMALEEVVDEACQDEMFYTNSGGGVTISGGEPLFQPEFTYCFLKACRERGLRTALDTCGHASWETLNRVLEHTDMVLYDLKHLDPQMHFQGTQVSNNLILDNLIKTIDSQKARVWIRVPVIPGYNDTEDCFRELAKVIKDRPVEKVCLLGYHEWGKSKYQALERDYAANQPGPMPKELLEPFKQVFEVEGIAVTIDH